MELRYDPQCKALYYKIVFEIGIAKCKEAFGEYIQSKKPDEGCPFTMVWHERKWRLTYWNGGGNVLVESSKSITPCAAMKTG